LNIPRIQGLVCKLCGLPLKDGGELCFSCRQTHLPLLIRASVEYKGVIPSSIYRFKYAGRKSLARSLTTLLKQTWERSPELHDINGIVSVPLHPKNERIRGYNQSELLAVPFARAITRPYMPALIRIRKTHSQTALNRLERQKNIQAAFELHPFAKDHPAMVRGMSFLLIDDVCTTTSTLSECARVLRRAGARSVKSLVLARDL
jgi:ComF family protein